MPGDSAADDAIVATDSSVADRPTRPACPALQLVVRPTPAMTAVQGSFATPRVVYRDHGFDVVAPNSNAEPIGIRGRRMTVSPTYPAMLSFGDIRIVGEGAWTWAEAGTDGTHLALGYLGDSPTLRTWSGAYASALRTPVMVPPGAGTSRGVAWSGDRWVMAWDDYDGPSYLTELAADGSPLAPPRQTAIALRNTTPAIVAYGNGVAAIGLDRMQGGYRIVFLRSGREDIVVSPPIPADGSQPRIAGWPADPSAVVLTYRDAMSYVHLQLVREDGSFGEDRVIIDPQPFDGRSTEIVPFVDGVAVADVGCGRAGSAGRIGVHRFDAMLDERGMPVDVPIDCSASVMITSIAASDTDVALVWLAPTGGIGDLQVDTAVVRCVE